MLRFNFCLRQSTAYRKSLQKLPKLSFMRLGQLFENRLLLTISATFFFTIINSCDKETMCLLQSMLSRALVFTFQFRLFFFVKHFCDLCSHTSFLERNAKCCKCQPHKMLSGGFQLVCTVCACVVCSKSGVHDKLYSVCRLFNILPIALWWVI